MFKRKSTDYYKKVPLYFLVGLVFLTENLQQPTVMLWKAQIWRRRGSQPVTSRSLGEKWTTESQFTFNNRNICRDIFSVYSTGQNKNVILCTYL